MQGNICIDSLVHFHIHTRIAKIQKEKKEKKYYQSTTNSHAQSTLT